MNSGWFRGGGGVNKAIQVMSKNLLRNPQFSELTTHTTMNLHTLRETRQGEGGGVYDLISMETHCSNPFCLWIHYAITLMEDKNKRGEE